MDRWQPAYVGAGRNLSDPCSQVPRAIEELARIQATRLVSVSSLYASKPFGPVAQPDYVNAVAGLLTQLEVTDFFARLRALEAALGRTPLQPRWGPRRLDLDLLLFAQLQ